MPTYYNLQNFDVFFFFLRLTMPISPSIICCLCLLANSMANNIWRRALIAPSIITNAGPNFQQENYWVKLFFACPRLCIQKPWCTVWCFDKTSMKCLVTNLMLSPYYNDISSETIKCYTSFRKDVLFGALAWNSNVAARFASAQGLTKGVYNYQKYSCGGFNMGTPWILFYLRKERTIKEIKITTQPYGWDPDLPSNAEIRIGSTQITNGDFSSYIYFGNIPSDVKAGNTYTLAIQSGIQGTYVSIKAIKNEMVICYLQIFD